MESVGGGGLETVRYVRTHHQHHCRENQCSSALLRHIKAPLHLVLLSSFDFLSVNFSFNLPCFFFVVLNQFASVFTS